MTFVGAAEGVLDDLLARSPVWASLLGDHRHDARLPDLSAEGTRAELAALEAHERALAAADGPTTADERVDAAMLSSLLAARRFELAQVRRAEWDPLVHLPGEALHTILSRPYAPAADRLRDLAGRLGAIPDALATARTVLANPSRLHVETARDQVDGVVRLAGEETSALVATEPGLTGRVEQAQRAAIEALTAFRDWLAARVDGGAPGHDPRLGADLWRAQLAHSLDTDLAPEAVAAAARDHLELVTEQITDVAAAYLAEPPGPDVVRRALDRVAEDAPDDTTILADARDGLAEAFAFCRQHQLVTVPDDPLELVEMPEFARGVAGAYCDPPGPLEPVVLPTFYAIAPTPADWPRERVDSFYREYNRAQLRNLAVHEAVPGHFLQLAHARRAAGPTRVRAAAWSGTFVEGWGVYSEELMATNGFGGGPVRLQQLKLQLRSTINALLDAGVHAGGLTRDEAMALMTGRGFQEEGEAHGKWRRALLTAGQLSTYFVGYTEVVALTRDLRRPAETDRAFHDRLLSHGSPSPRHLRTLLA